MTPTSHPPAGKTRTPTRQRILDAAIEVFSRRGFHDATMDDIAVQAGVAKGSLYYNFPSKTGLFVALVSEGMEGFLARLRKEIVSDLSFPDHFRRLVSVHLDVMIDHLELLTIALNPSVYGFDQATMASIRQAWNKYLEFLVEQLRYGQERGYMRAGDPTLMAHEVLGSLGGILRYYVSAAHGELPGIDRPFSREWLTEELLRFFGQGILSEKGRGCVVDSGRQEVLARPE